MFRRAALSCVLILTACAIAEERKDTRIFPLDRATILTGAKFDIKIEFQSVIPEPSISVEINGKSLKEFFGRRPVYIEKEIFLPPLTKEEQAAANAKKAAEAAEREKTGAKAPKEESDESQLINSLIPPREATALLLRDCVITTPGKYKVVASDGNSSVSVAWEVYETSKQRKAKNVVIMIGDGMSVAHRTAARVLSKGIKEGKANGKLAMDDMAHMSLLGTSGVDSVVTDSANSACAYTSGHKSSNAALNVYADRTKDAFDDPQVETVANLARRMKNMSIGIVTTTAIQDATPASMYAHTRSRGKFSQITEMLYNFQPEVVLGGGLEHFLPKGTKGAKRNDDKNFIDRFKSDGYTYITNEDELKAVDTGNTKKLLGLFHSSNMDGILDRRFLPPKKDAKFPKQPDLPQMAKAALEILAKSENGFVLLVESGSIDKFSHALDWERAVFETIMFDQTIALVKEFAAKRNDTLILVTADHCHGIGIAGIVDDTMKAGALRDKVGHGYPNYEDANGDGYPDRVDVSKRLAVFFSNLCDYYETYKPKLDGPFSPSMRSKTNPIYQAANDKYEKIVGAQLRQGNFPRSTGSGSHAADDVVLTADGPGSEMVRGFMDNTEVFRVIVNALGL